MVWHTATVSQGATLMSCCKHPVTVCAWWLLPQTKEFAELAASVAQLGRRVARVTGAPGALSDTERALAAAQVGVGQAMAPGPQPGLCVRLSLQQCTPCQLQAYTVQGYGHHSLVGSCTGQRGHLTPHHDMVCQPAVSVLSCRLCLLAMVHAAG